MADGQIHPTTTTGDLVSTSSDFETYEYINSSDTDLNPSDNTITTTTGNGDNANSPKGSWLKRLTSIEGKFERQKLVQVADFNLPANRIHRV